MRLPTPFQPLFQPGSKVGSTPYSNPLPTHVCSTPHTPLCAAPLLGRAARNLREGKGWENVRAEKGGGSSQNLTAYPLSIFATLQNAALFVANLANK